MTDAEIATARAAPWTAYDVLRELNWHDVVTLPRVKPESGRPSNSELRRMLDQHAVRINGGRPGPKDIVTWPIDDLVFFPGAQRQVTLR